MHYRYYFIIDASNEKRGYWKPGGFGYTENINEAGIFTNFDLINYNLNECTLILRGEQFD